MRATLIDACPEFTRPAYSSIRLGGVPAAWTRVGASIDLGISLIVAGVLAVTLSGPWVVAEASQLKRRHARRNL